jgi:hypothetical protein
VIRRRARTAIRNQRNHYGPSGSPGVAAPPDQGVYTQHATHIPGVHMPPDLRISNITRGIPGDVGVCHGADLNGLGPVPGMAGRSPSYLVRQMYDMQAGARKGVWTPLMTKVVS